MRFKLSRWLNEPVIKDTATPDIRILFSPSLEASDSQQENVPDLELEEAAELVDTTLFRAYMLCRPQLVGPLVRRPNRCVPNVVQEMLEHAHVFTPNSKLTERNIVILQSFYWARDYIDRRCSCCKI